MNITNSNLETGCALVNGAWLYYERLGKGECIVLVHGMGVDCRMWDDQFFMLAKEFDVVRFDLRGFGKSALPTDVPYAHHQDLKGLLDFLKISHAVLVGLSMGGRVVLDFALTFPKIPTSIVLVDSVVHGYSFQGFSQKAMIDAAKDSGIDAANKAWLEHELFRHANRIPSLADSLRTMISSYSGWHWHNKNPWTPLDPPTIEQLGDIRIPSLVIVGELDLPDYLNISDILVRLIPNAQKVILPGAGHMSNMEKPIEFNEIIMKFVRPR